jgi:molybdopterin-guanine dinucleotide biosynthesis protein
MKIKLSKIKPDPKIVIQPISLKKDAKLIVSQSILDATDKINSPEPNKSSTAPDIDNIITSLNIRDIILFFSGALFILASLYFFINSADFIFIDHASKEIVKTNSNKNELIDESEKVLDLIVEPLNIKSVLDNKSENIVVNGFQGVSLGDETFQRINLIKSKDGADLFLTNNERKTGYSDITKVAFNTTEKKVYKINREITFKSFYSCTDAKNKLSNQLEEKYPNSYESKEIYNWVKIGERDIKIIDECNKTRSRKIYVIANDQSITPSNADELNNTEKPKDKSVILMKSLNNKVIVKGFQGISLGDQDFEKIKLIKRREGADLFLAKIEIDEKKSDQTHIAVNTEKNKVYKIHREITYNNRYDCSVALENLTSALEKKYPKIYQSSMLFNLVQSGSRKIEIISKCNQITKGRKIFVIAQDSSLTPSEIK